MDQEFQHIQRCMKQLNGTLVIIHPERLEVSQMELIPQLFLQIKIYGSKLIDLYQTLDEICPSERIEKVNSSENVLLLLNQQSQEWQSNSQQILHRAFINQEEEYLSSALDLLQSTDYQINDTISAIKILQQAHRVKDVIMSQMFQYVNHEGPDLRFKHQAEMIHQLLSQYDQVLPQLLEENQQLKLQREISPDCREKISNLLFAMESDLKTVNRFLRRASNIDQTDLMRYDQKSDRFLQNVGDYLEYLSQTIVKTIELSENAIKGTDHMSRMSRSHHSTDNIQSGYQLVENLIKLFQEVMTSSSDQDSLLNAIQDQFYQLAQIIQKIDINLPNFDQTATTELTTHNNSIQAYKAPNIQMQLQNTFQTILKHRLMKENESQKNSLNQQNISLSNQLKQQAKDIESSVQIQQQLRSKLEESESRATKMTDNLQKQLNLKQDENKQIQNQLMAYNADQKMRVRDQCELQRTNQMENELNTMKDKFIQLDAKFTENEQFHQDQILKQQEIANQLQSKLEGQLNKYQQENSSLKLEHEDVVYKLQNAVSEIAVLVDRLRQLSETTTKNEMEYKKQLHIKQERERELEQQYLKMRSTNHVDEINKENYDQSIDQLHEKFAKFRKLYESRVSQLLHQISSIQRGLKQKDAEVQFLHETVQKLEQLVALHEKGKYRPNSTQKFQGGQLGDMLSSENKRLQDVIKTSSSDLSYLRIQLDNVLKQQVDLEETLHQTQKENSFLKQKSFDGEYRDLLGRYQKVVERNEHLSQQANEYLSQQANESIISQVRFLDTTKD